MSDEELAEFEALANEATVGPWTEGSDNDGEMMVYSPIRSYPDRPDLADYFDPVIDGCGCCGSPSGSGNAENDRKFIIACRQHALPLVAEVRRLKGLAAHSTPSWSKHVAHWRTWRSPRTWTSPPGAARPRATTEVSWPSTTD